MRRILFLAAYPIEDASCRYRIHQFLPYLEQAGYICEVASFCSPELFAVLHRKGKLTLKLARTLQCATRRLIQLRQISKFDVIVIHREAFPFFAPLVENWIIRRHPKVIFSFDDAIYTGHEQVAELAHPRLYRLKHGRRYDDVIRHSSHVIAGNRILAEYARRLNRNVSVSVVPTVVDCRKYRFRQLRENPRPITIGWMGSRSTAPYLDLTEPALKKLAQTFAGRMRLRFVGAPHYQPSLPDSSSVPFMLDSEIEELQSFDIGLMPLPDTEWTRGKCAFKAIQYMASGVPVVASPVGVTTDLIHHNANGLLASSAEEWFRELSRLVCDASLRQRLALTARRTIEDSYSLEQWAPRVVELFDQILGVHNGQLDAVVA